MTRTIIVQAEEPVACPKCNHRFPLCDGISRQAIERHAADLERSLAEHRKKLEAQLAAEAKAQFDVQLKALQEALSAKEGTLARFRSEELSLRKQLREAEDARKLKDEQQEIGAEFAVIVSATMPRDAREPFLRDSDVWVTRYDAARPLAECLRAALLELAKQRQANHGRSEKMELLYNYICSPQFGQRLKSLYDGFVAMREELEAEKAALARIWKKREAQLTQAQREELDRRLDELDAEGPSRIPWEEVYRRLRDRRA